MCGIVGFISPQREEDALKRMLAVQAHRGPDDRGVWIEEINSACVHLGHNRLAIQDLSSLGHQPFVSTCGHYVIVFNGEVYNFKAIRSELEKLGYQFRSQSDTEVILYAYQAWGMDALEKFIGMFAFAIVDSIKEKLFLVRDRAGVKPLYYYPKGKSFLFASELKSFHEHSSFKKELNREVLPYYFQFGYIPAPHTIFQQTHKLEAGHYLELNLKNLEYHLVQYWSVDACYEQEKFDKSETEIIDELEEILTDAVELRMVSDVPVGVFLSGGYDSSLVTALLSKHHSEKLHTYTIGFKEKKYNEADHAKAVAQHFKTNHTEYYVAAKDMLQRVEQLPFYYDEPFGDSSALPTMLVSDLARKEITVALSADGGDEVFCGYSKYFFLNKFSSIFSSDFKKLMVKSLVNGLGEKRIEQINSRLPKRVQQTNIRDKYSKLTRAINANSLEEMFLEATSYVDQRAIQKLLTIEAKTKYYHPFAMSKGKNFLDEMMRVDYKTFMVDDVLTKVDRATMSVSLEGREPLLDHRIVEYMAQVPVAQKYKNRQGKYLSRQILYRYIPSAMVDRPKAGFQIPLISWLRGDLRLLVEKHLDADCLDGDVFDIDEVLRLKQALLEGRSDNISIVWFILMYQMWRERWFG